jgi:hypothetical protein
MMTHIWNCWSKVTRQQRSSGSVGFALDNLLEDVERLRAEYGLAVDEEGRRGTHAELLSEVALVRDQRCVAAGVHAAIERLSVQPELGSKLLQVVLTECALVLAAVFVEE